MQSVEYAWKGREAPRMLRSMLSRTRTQIPVRDSPANALWVVHCEYMLHIIRHNTLTIQPLTNSLYFCIPSRHFFDGPSCLDPRGRSAQ